MAKSALFDRICPDWPAPANIAAFTSCRQGGSSAAPWQTLNLAEHVGDNSQHVRANRQLLQQQSTGLERIQWLDQRHTTDLVAADGKTLFTADGCYTSAVGLACAVLTADCLPLLMCDSAGQQVAAVHAGWRGLLGGIVENSLATFSVPAKDLLVWLGPAISQSVFEVGAEVRQAFLQATSAATQLETAAAFLPNPKRTGHYFADLYQLARIRLQACGVVTVYGGNYCSYQQADRFYSYRRDGITGRMASVIYKQT
jgi:YfiH family protein